MKSQQFIFGSLIIVSITYFFILTSCSFFPKDSLQQITPSSPFIKYTARTLQQRNSILIAYSGSSIEFKLTGKTAVLSIIDLGNGDAQHTNYLTIEVNGKCDSILQLQQHESRYNISALLKKDTNVIKIFKRTEASVGIIEFQGLSIGNEASLIQHSPSEHKLLWIGNSLTCGYGNESNIAAPPNGNPSTGFTSKNENNYNSWSSISSRKLNAESHQICYSGKGVYRNFDNSRSATLPMIFNQTFPNENYQQQWKHINFQPELTIINLSTNDFGPEMNDTNNLCDSTFFVNTYIDFLNQLQNHYPNSKFILVIGNALNDHWPANLNRLTRCRTYIQSVAINCNHPELVSIFELTTQTGPFGEDWHPSYQTHQKMSCEITPFIRKKMNWKN